MTSSLVEFFHYRYDSMMDVDRILKTLNDHQVDYLLIGGINFLLHHQPVLTYDVDIWVADIDLNLQNLNAALIELEAAWGPSEKDWKPVPKKFTWLKQQGCFCLTTEAGALDIFRDVLGLEGHYDECSKSARCGKTATGISYRGLSDNHMLLAEEALDLSHRRADRINILRRAIEN